MLSELEITQFEVFGFVVLRGFLSQQDVYSLNSEFDVALERAESTMERASFRKQLNWWNFMPDTCFTASLLEQPRFLDKVKQLLGDDVVASFSASNSFSGDRTDWHPDTSQPNWRGLKFGIYLQSLDATNGALRMIPGSHREPLHSDFRRIPLKEAFLQPGTPEEQHGLSVDQVPAHIAAVECGDVVIFDNYTWHGSYGGGEDRRLITMGYFAAPKTTEQEHAVREQVKAEAKIREIFPLLRRDQFWMNNPDNNQERGKWIATLGKYGFLTDSS